MMVRVMSDLEMNFVSIERAREYTEIPNEVRNINLNHEIFLLVTILFSELRSQFIVCILDKLGKFILSPACRVARVRRNRVR